MFSFSGAVFSKRNRTHGLHVSNLRDGFQARVLQDGDMTEPFNVSAEFLRGACSNPFSSFFLVALDWVSRQAFGDIKGDRDPTYPAAEVRILGLRGRHGLAEPEDRRPHA